MEALDRVKELGKTAAEKQAEYEAMREQLQKVTPPPQPPRLPAARGVLQPSMVFPGTGAIGKRYMLIDPETGKTTAYVQTATADIDLSKYVGTEVAVYGATTFDTTLQRPIVDPNEIEILRTGATLPGPPQPIIRVRQPASQPTAVPGPIPAPPPVPPAPTTQPTSRPVPPKPTIQPTSQPAPPKPSTQASAPTPATGPTRLPVVTDKVPPEPVNDQEYE